MLGQIFEVALRAVEEALSEDAGRADRDLGLDGVVARSERVGLRIEEASEARALIILKDE
jgi:hypothetical protein